MSSLTALVSVVIPVRDGERWLGDCLASVLAAAEGAQVVVVDDGSRDGSAALARQQGVTVLRSDGRGPYEARNMGWRSTATPLVAFTDVRSRPHPEWLAGLCSAMTDDAVAIAGGEVVALPGRSVATRYVAKWQPLAPQHGLGNPFLPYLPTCNLITRRSVLVALDGFRAIRSGGDLDFSWRTQLAGLGEVRYAPGAGVDWLPRETLREVRRQWYRYGAARPALWEAYRDQGLPVEPPPGLGRFTYQQMRHLFRGLRGSPVRDWDVELVSLLCQWAYRQGYVHQQRRPVRAP